MEKDTIVVLDFGSQYNQLIVRRIRSLGVYAELLPFDTPLKTLQHKSIKGIILSGSPNSVHTKTSPKLSQKFWQNISVPILGICYGLQHMIYADGGSIQKSSHQEYGGTLVSVDNQRSALFASLPQKSTMWMSHADYITCLPNSWKKIAESKNCPFAGVQHKQKKRFGIQFHPEVTHSKYGTQILQNFALNICKASPTWSMQNYLQEQIKLIRKRVGKAQVICGLSGGVDSAVVAALLARAIGSQLHCIFVDHGLLRKNEREAVQSVFSSRIENLLIVDASKTFLQKLKSIKSPEQKRLIIGSEFIRTFSKVAKKIPDTKFLAQGTLYSDVVESGHGGASDTIKSHHNVGGLPKNLKFELIEPLRLLFKDEVRQLGLELGLKKSIVYRQPFPGPGLAVRIIGNITAKKIRAVQESDAILHEELAKAKWDTKIWQFFTVFTGALTVGVKGDSRAYGYTIAIRAVHSLDGMTASIAHIPYKVLEKISSRIVNEIDTVTRVVYDISSKPPGTIEWE